MQLGVQVLEGTRKGALVFRSGADRRQGGAMLMAAKTGH